MRIFKHAFLSLVRKPTKAIMIFGILFVVFGLVFTGILIRNSVTESKKYIRIEMGAVVSYVPNYVKYSNTVNDSDSSEDFDYTQLELSSSVAYDIAEDSAVKKIYLTENGYVMSSSLISGMDNGGERVYYDDDSEQMNYAYFTTTGNNQPVPVEFENNNLTLVSGRHMTEDDFTNNAYVVLISEELALANNITVGDTISFTPENYNYSYDENGNYIEEDEGEPIDFEVIGLYSGAASYGVDNIFTSLEITQMLSGRDEMEEEMAPSNIRFLLYDPLDVEAFIERSSTLLPSEYTQLTSNDSAYKTLTRPLDLIATITNILIVVVFIAGAIIVIAIVTIFVRDRKFEIGLLLSSGESKIKIVSQFIVEIFVVAIIAFALSAGASQLSSDYIAKWIVTNQLVVDDSEEQTNYYYYNSTGTNDTVDMEQVADEFDISLSFGVILNLMLVSFVLLLVAASIPLLIILSFKPREALQD